MFFDWAAQPYFVLIATFVFPPFFVMKVVGDPIEGQVLWAWTTGAAALATAVIAPLSGALADRTGRSKPVFAAFTMLGCIGAAAIWWAAPGQTFAVPFAIASFIVATVGFEVATALNNGMLLKIVPQREAGAVAWRGWALGGASGLLMLLGFAGLFVEGDGPSIFGSEPLIRFPAGSDGVARLSGPLTAGWMLLFCLPLLSTFDDARRTAGLDGGAADRRAEPLEDRPAVPLLWANMILTDALTALFAFGAVYGAMVFRWDATMLGLFGIGLTAAGVFGSLLCIPLDRMIGAERIIKGACVLIVLVGGFILGLEPGSIFGRPVPAYPGGLFADAAAVAFALAGLVIGAASTALQAALRSRFIEIVPSGRTGRWFGYFALSGKATAFLGPVLVGAVISATGSTKLAMGSILVLILIGGALLSAGVPPKIAARRGSRPV